MTPYAYACIALAVIIALLVLERVLYDVLSRWSRLVLGGGAGATGALVWAVLEWMDRVG